MREIILHTLGLRQPAPCLTGSRRREQKSEGPIRHSCVLFGSLRAARQKNVNGGLFAPSTPGSGSSVFNEKGIDIFFEDYRVVRKVSSLKTTNESGTSLPFDKMRLANVTFEARCEIATPFVEDLFVPKIIAVWDHLVAVGCCVRQWHQMIDAGVENYVHILPVAWTAL
jgi:hypothetical protein